MNKRTQLLVRHIESVASRETTTVVSCRTASGTMGMTMETVVAVDTEVVEVVRRTAVEVVVMDRSARGKLATPPSTPAVQLATWATHTA